MLNLKQEIIINQGKPQVIKEEICEEQTTTKIEHNQTTPEKHLMDTETFASFALLAAILAYAVYNFFKPEEELDIEDPDLYMLTPKDYHLTPPIKKLTEGELAGKEEREADYIID